MHLLQENSRSNIIVYLGFAGAALILITLGFDVIIYRNMNELRRIDQEKLNSYKTVELLRRMETNLNLALVSYRDFLLTGQKELLQRFLYNRPVIRQEIRQLRQLLLLTGGGCNELDRFESLVDKEFEALQAMLEARRQGEMASETPNGAHKPVQFFLEDIQNLLAEIIAREDVTLARSLEKSQATSQQSFLIVILGNLTAFVLSFGSIFLLNQQINRRRQVERALRTERDRLETVTHNIGAGLIVMSSSLNILWANHVIKQMFGDIDGRAYQEIFPEQQAETETSLARDEVRSGDATLVSEKELPDAQQRRHWFQIIRTPIKNEHSKPIAFLELYAVSYTHLTLPTKRIV